MIYRFLISACPVEFNLQMHFPKFINYGSQDMMYIQPFGTPTPGSILNNQTTYHFDGNVRFNIDFFKQSLPKLFIQVSVPRITSILVLTICLMKTHKWVFLQPMKTQIKCCIMRNFIRVCTAC